MPVGKWINGYEGMYSVTVTGDVYSYRRYKDGRKLKACEESSGYLYVGLSRDGRTKNMLIHRAVAETYIPCPADKKQVNHIDGNKHNNAVDNLEWCTASENMQHADANGLRKVQKKVMQCTRTGTVVHVYNSIRDAQVAMNAPKSAVISQALCDPTRVKTAYGFKWSYLNEESGAVESIKPTKV